MTRSSSLVLAALLTALAGACNDEDTSPTAPSPEPGQAAVAAATTYTIKNLGTLGGNSSAAYDINNMGQTVGASRTKGDQTHAFIYQAGVMKDLGALAGGFSEADAINDAGVVVGYSTVLSGAERAVRWQNGTKKNLGTLGGRNSRATDINEDGTIVGWSEIKSGDRHAFVYQNGVMKDIGTLGGKSSEANGINKAGKVVGVSRTASGKNHAFAWINGKFQDLGDGGNQFGFATAINSARIVGGFGPPPDAEGGDLEVVQPWVFSAGVFTRIGTQRHAGFANDVNKDGIVVGRDEDDRLLDPGSAWVRGSAEMTQYLPELVEDGWDSAEGINSFGTIVGFSEGPDGWFKAVIWRPQ
jgi:probable HAF family extracellular repeat protein